MSYPGNGYPNLGHRRAYYRAKQRRNLLWRRIRFGLILLALLLAGICVQRLLSTEPVSRIMTARAQAKKAEQYKKLRDRIADYIKNYRGQYGVYYYDLASGQGFGVNDEEEYPAASTLKVPINLYLYDRIGSGAVNPKTMLTYLKEDYEEGTGAIRYQKIGARYSIEELSRLSLENSDNVAANMLIRYLGMQNIKNYMRQAGGRVVVDGQDLSSPRDMGLYMKLVYDAYKRGGLPGNEIMNHLLNTKLDDRLAAQLPDSVKVAHKVGNQAHVVNDVGVVFAGRPYVVSIMSKDVNDDEAPEVIAHVSKMIYDSAVWK